MTFSTLEGDIARLYHGHVLVLWLEGPSQSTSAQRLKVTASATTFIVNLWWENVHGQQPHEGHNFLKQTLGHFW